LNVTPKERSKKAMTSKAFTAIRIASGKTQAELAAWLGIHLRTVQKYALDRRIPGPIEKLMLQLQVEIAPETQSQRKRK
jgi:DNA-binding transcriptional regulator YiaG